MAWNEAAPHNGKHTGGLASSNMDGVVSLCRYCNVYLPWEGPGSWMEHVLAEHPDSREAAEAKRLIERRASHLSHELQHIANNGKKKR